MTTSSLLSDAPQNLQVDAEPIGLDNPTVNKLALQRVIFDFLSGEVQQTDAASKAIIFNACGQVIENLIVLAEKQHDYGPGNIASFGEVGVLVRTSDKVARMRNLQGKVAKNEALGDSWLDVANYGVIAQLVRAGLWPNCEAKHLLSPPAPAKSDFSERDE